MLIPHRLRFLFLLAPLLVASSVAIARADSTNCGAPADTPQIEAAPDSGFVTHRCPRIKANPKNDAIASGFIASGFIDSDIVDSEFIDGMLPGTLSEAAASKIVREEIATYCKGAGVENPRIHLRPIARDSRMAWRYLALFTCGQ